MKIKYTIKKFNGDSSYDWAVFRAQDVRGMRSPIFYGQARPVVSGLTRSDAQWRKKELEARETKTARRATLVCKMVE